MAAKLKPKQLQLIEALLAEPMLPDTEVAKLLGINRNTVRVWKQKPEFQEELKKRLRETWEDSERTAVETMQSLARAGDFKASKYILDSLGYSAPVKIEADVNATTEIIVSIDE